MYLNVYLRIAAIKCNNPAGPATERLLIPESAKVINRPIERGSDLEKLVFSIKVTWKAASSLGAHRSQKHSSGLLPVPPALEKRTGSIFTDIEDILGRVKGNDNSGLGIRRYSAKD